MKISYNWLNEYLPEKIEPEKLSSILTSVGLEVESLEKFEEVKGGLKGLIIGEVTECVKHPEADKLKLTKVNIGSDNPLQIICGANNVAAGQKVIVAPVGSTIHPVKGDAMLMKKAKIRGIESEGMICSEDEIGLGENHEGIMVLPHDAIPGTEVSEFFKPYSDWIFEIGITPNRMDAMSHWGVAKDVCAYLSHHNKKENYTTSPFKNNPIAIGFKADNNTSAVKVIIENTNSCQRYSGVSISNIKVEQSPAWLQQKLKSIGIRPINNIVDITNYILHDTGQPLHAFDADKIKNNTVIIKNLAAQTPFITLDEKERKLSAEDLMICNGNTEPMCFGGVFGGLQSGVTSATKNIFLESAFFEPTSIRKTSLLHNLRTDASSRFEKGVDISNTVNVLKKAAILIKEIAGGEITSDIIDVYPVPKEKTEVVLKNHYLKKISGKNYHPDTIKNILKSLGFEILKEGLDDIRVAVPFSKPDILLPVDIIEEIMRIDGLDNVEIPLAITISPAIETAGFEFAYQEKISNYLTGLGFSEALNNSITNNAYYNDEVLQTSVKLLNNLSTELDVMRPSLLETGLEMVAHNLNHKNNDLQFFEFGNTYSTTGISKYKEEKHLCLFITGDTTNASWRNKESKADIFYIKGVCEKLLHLSGIANATYNVDENSINIFYNDESIGKIETIPQNKLLKFSIKQPVLFADFYWEKLSAIAKKIKIEYMPVAKYPEVHRDLSIIIDKKIAYQNVEALANSLNLTKLTAVKLFDVFESEKIGADKRSLAINFTFLDKEKTLTDKEIDAMINKLITTFEKQLGAEIRKV